MDKELKTLKDFENADQLPKVEVGKVFDVTTIKDAIFDTKDKGTEYKYPQIADFLNIETFQPAMPNNIDILQTILNTAGNAIAATNFYGEPKTKSKGIFTDLIEQSRK